MIGLPCQITSFFVCALTILEIVNAEIIINNKIVTNGNGSLNVPQLLCHLGDQKNITSDNTIINVPAN
jgi:hypothetical protein